MTPNVPVVDPSASVAAARDVLAQRRFDFIGDIAVCEGDTLVGLLRIEDLLSAEPAKSVREVMDPDPAIVTHDVDQEMVAWKSVQRGEGALAVVDDRGAFLGLIPPYRLLGVLLQEHEEDMARLGGFLRGSASARQASTEPTLMRLWHRLPWLLLGLLGAVGAAAIVNAFEGRLREHVLIAFFIPGVVYLADAVGTQTETLVIRGLSVGVGIRDVVLRELLTGILAGVALGIAFLPIGVLLWDNVQVVVTVSLALVVACSLATVVATALPWILSRAGRDPAFGSGPLATVIQDLLSIVVYLALASAIV
jgi:magnesium transporter